MRRLIQFELAKMSVRPRVFLSMGLMVILVALIHWGLKTEGEQALEYLLQAIDKSLMVVGNILNGQLVAFFIFNTLWIHVPVLIVIVTGDLFSAELETGTIRMALTRPLSRVRFALAKHVTALIYVFVFLLFWGLISWWPAMALFGRGDLVVFFDGMQILEEKELTWRFLCAFGFAFLGMGAFAIFSVAISFFTRKSMVTILVSLGVLVISTLLQTLAPAIFRGWESFLLTYHLARWQLFFSTEVDWNGILTSMAWLIGFSGICIAASLYRFNRMNITE